MYTFVLYSIVNFVKLQIRYFIKVCDAEFKISLLLLYIITSYYYSSAKSHRPNYQTLFIYFLSSSRFIFVFEKNTISLPFISLILPRRHDPTIYQDFNIWGNRCKVNRCLNRARSYGVAVSNERGKATDRLALPYPRDSPFANDGE